MHEHKPRIFLDIDATLISAEPLDTYNTKKNSEYKSFVHYYMNNFYIVCERPHLQEFLDFLFANFTVCIWTAASKDYALFIIEKIILQNKSARNLDFIFFVYHCSVSEYFYKNDSKNLRLIWEKFDLPEYTGSNTFILDDYYDDVYKSQPDNCIVAKQFDFKLENSANDTFLSDLIPELKKLLESYTKDKNIRLEIPKINKALGV